jgi:hypothetical protein
MPKDINKLLKTLESTPPPDGLRERVLHNLPLGGDIKLNALQRALYQYPLPSACAIALALSGMLWAAFGADYAALAAGFFMVR